MSKKWVTSIDVGKSICLPLKYLSFGMNVCVGEWILTPNISFVLKIQLSALFINITVFSKRIYITKSGSELASFDEMEEFYHLQRQALETRQIADF